MVKYKMFKTKMYMEVWQKDFEKFRVYNSTLFTRKFGRKHFEKFRLCKVKDVQGSLVETL